MNYGDIQKCNIKYYLHAMSRALLVIMLQAYNALTKASIHCGLNFRPLSGSKFQSDISFFVQHFIIKISISLKCVWMYKCIFVCILVYSLQKVLFAVICVILMLLNFHRKAK